MRKLPRRQKRLHTNDIGERKRKKQKNLSRKIRNVKSELHDTETKSGNDSTMKIIFLSAILCLLSLSYSCKKYTVECQYNIVGTYEGIKVNYENTLPQNTDSVEYEVVILDEQLMIPSWSDRKFNIENCEGSVEENEGEHEIKITFFEDSMTIEDRWGGTGAPNSAIVHSLKKK